MPLLRYPSRYYVVLAIALLAIPVLAQTPPAQKVPTISEFSPQQVAVSQTSAWEMLSKAAGSKKGAERKDALAAFSLVGNDQAISIIENGLTDKDAEVRAQAINCLADLNAQSSIPKLKPLLSDKSPEVVFAAARALSQLGDPGGRDVLIEVLTGERHVSGSLIGPALDWAKQISPGNLVFLGISQAASILVSPYAGVGVVAVRQLVGDHSGQARVTSAQSLAGDDSARAIEILEKALRDKNWAVRAAAAQALGNAPSTAPIASLMPLLRDKKREVRFIAAASIIRLALPPNPATMKNSFR